MINRSFGSGRAKMKEDNTPTVISRRRKPTPHQRLRLNKAKELKKIGALKKKECNGSKGQKPGDADPEEMVSTTPQIPSLKKDVFSKPAKPPAKFRKRQIHKSWLPTHLYHTKRAHMTPPKEPLWRFALPLTPTEKCYRLTHRAVTSRGCVAWDISYIATIGLEGVEASLLGLLRSIGVDANMFVGQKGAKWRRGMRCWESWINERDGEKKGIAKVSIMWCLDAVGVQDLETKNPTENGTRGCGNHGAMRSDGHSTTGAVHNQVVDQQPKNPRRRLLLRVHPSAFFQTWTEILKVAKIQRPAVMVEDLRFEIGSIEVIGPESTEALVGVLHQAKPVTSVSEPPTADGSSDDWEDIETPEWVWSQLAGVTNPATLPANCILGFNVSDPRLRHPPKTVTIPEPEQTNDALLELISSWPPDRTSTAHDIFDRSKRLTASRQLQSQKAINRRKSEAFPGEYPASSPKDPNIPVLLVASRTTTYAGQGSWTLLLPWDCVLPVWYSLLHYPLASGGNPRFGGLQEKRQIAFEHNVPWYPADYPGTKAGFEWELLEREKAKQTWENRPKGKRITWEGVDLGNGKKGEVGLGWACDWERLFQGPPLPGTDGEDKTGSEKSNKTTKEVSVQEAKTAERPRSFSGSIRPPTESAHPPLAIQNVNSPLSAIPPLPHAALSPVHLTLLTTGHATRNARVYRLPTTDPELRAKWLALAHPAKPSKQSRPFQPPAALPKNAIPHQRTQHLAASLLNPPSVRHADGKPPKPSDPAYPCVPDEGDLIGFVTTGNYQLGEGRCEAIGNIAIARVMGEEKKKSKGGDKNICIVREAGQSIGRLARWTFV